MMRALFLLTAVIGFGCTKKNAEAPAALATPPSALAKPRPEASAATSAPKSTSEPVPENSPPTAASGELPPDTSDPETVEPTCEARKTRIAATIDDSRACETDEDCVEIHLHCFAPCKDAVRGDARVSILAAASAYFDACGQGGCGKPKCAQARAPVCVSERCTMER